MKLLIIARQQMKLFSKSPNVLVLFVAGTLFMIFIFGQAFASIFASSSSGFRSIDYFGVTILTLAAFQGSAIASWGIFKEKKSNTEPRLAIAPVGRLTIVFGTFLGSWATLYAMSCFIMLFSSVALSVRYGASLLPAFLLLAAESLAASSLGVSLAVIFGRERAASGVMNALVPLLVFLGGGYMIIPDSGFLHDASWVSPLRWLNLAMLRASRGGPNEYLAPAVLFCVLFSAFLLSLAGLKTWRRK